MPPEVHRPTPSPAMPGAIKCVKAQGAWRAAFDAAKADPKMTREQIERLARKELERQTKLESGK